MLKTVLNIIINTIIALVKAFSHILFTTILTEKRDYLLCTKGKRLRIIR